LVAGKGFQPSTFNLRIMCPKSRISIPAEIHIDSTISIIFL